jgi:hypothetical protein
VLSGYKKCCKSALLEVRSSVRSALLEIRSALRFVKLPRSVLSYSSLPIKKQTQGAVKSLTVMPFYWNIRNFSFSKYCCGQDSKWNHRFTDVSILFHVCPSVWTLQVCSDTVRPCSHTWCSSVGKGAPCGL